MAKQALCVKSIEDINNIIKNPELTVDTMLVDREICEKPENGYLQIIPYATFYNLDLESGRIKFVQYRRASSITEERLSAKTSIGFGGHIDSENDIDADASSTDNGIINYKLTNEQLIRTIINATKREIREELGEDLLVNLNIKTKTQDFIFFTGNPDIEVNKVHLGVSIPIELNKEQFELFFKEAVINKDEIDEISFLSINLGAILEEFDNTRVLNSIAIDLSKTHNLEDWSSQVFQLITLNTLNTLKSKIKYKDLLQLINLEKLEEETSKQEEIVFN